MILDTFSLQGKVAVVSGCDTGLGQGMAVGLAEAGCDIVGINIVEPTETIERVTALGGTLMISCTHGTRVSVSLPLRYA